MHWRPPIVRPVFLSILIVAAAVVYIYDPSLNEFYPECLFHKLTGLYCPGCGSTRAMHQLLHGHIAAAFKLNPLTVTALPFLIFGMLAETGVLTSQKRPSPRYIKILIAAVVLFWILRNIPVEPFSYLRPK
ncbi:MAG: DUF2752 domain-containing protein [Nitrospirae bacterium]|nr:DUF2752 domain-containing protein [Nitrospirota bacterium]